MTEIEIYFSDDSEFAEFEATQKGYRLDVYIKVEEKYFNVRVYDFIRLKQDFNDEIQSDGYYLIEPNLILVKEVNQKEIKFTVCKLHKQRYFNNLKPLEHIDITQLKRI